MEARDGFVEFTLGAEELAKVAMEIGDIGLNGDGAGDKIDCALGLSGLAEKDAEEMEGEGVVGLFDEDLAVEVSSFGEFSGAVEIYAGVELLGKGIEGCLGLRFHRRRGI